MLFHFYLYVGLTYLRGLVVHEIKENIKKGLSHKEENMPMV